MSTLCIADGAYHFWVRGKGSDQRRRRARLRRIRFPLRSAVLVALLLAACAVQGTTASSVLPTPTAASIATATAASPPTATTVPTATTPPTATATSDQRINAYIAHLTQTQQIGQLLMLSVYANAYTSALDQPLRQWDIANVIVFDQYQGGALKPPTLVGMTQLVHELHARANQPLIVATDEEGGLVDRLAPYYGASPSPQSLAATGNPQRAYAQAQLDAQRLRAIGINTDFAPLADVYQGGAVDRSRMFGTTPAQVDRYAGAFLDGLQQQGVAGTLKHWPGLGAAPANPDFGLPTVTRTQAQLNAVDFAAFRGLLAHQPGMIMTTHVLVPAYDAHLPASLSPTLITGVLRQQLGYQGVVVTDALDAQGLLQFMAHQGYTNPDQASAEAAVEAIVAGNDIVECPIEADRLAAVVAAVTKAVQTGRISSARLHQALVRIIALKVRLGLVTLPAH